jgi:hypothetical protein
LAPNDSHVNAGPLYTLQLDAARVDYTGLEARRADQQARNQRRAQTARQGKQPPVVRHTPLCATTGGEETNPLLCDNSPPLLYHNTTPPIVAQIPPPIVAQQHNNQGKPVENQGETAPPPADTFDELTSARVKRQAALAERATAAATACPPEPCPAWGDLSTSDQAALAVMLAPYADEPEPIARRQVAWFRQEHKRERRLHGEWWTALQAVIRDEVDKRLPTGPARASPRRAEIPIVASWD